MRNVGLLVSIGLAAILIITLIIPGGDHGPQLAPDFTLPTLDGTPVTLSDYRGSVVLLDFWASWCSPCRKSFPDLDAMASKYEDRGLVLLVVSLDKSADRAREYLTGEGYGTTNILWGSLDDARAVKTSFGVVGIPRTFLIDREGLIQYAGSPTGITDNTILQWL